LCAQLYIAVQLIIAHWYCLPYKQIKLRQWQHTCIPF